MKTKNVFTNYALKIAFSISFMLFFSCESKELGTAEELEAKVKASSVLSADNIESGQKTYTFSQAAGGLRSYYISIPKNYSKEKKYPHCCICTIIWIMDKIPVIFKPVRFISRNRSHSSKNSF